MNAEVIAWFSDLVIGSNFGEYFRTLTKLTIRIGFCCGLGRIFLMRSSIEHLRLTFAYLKNWILLPYSL